MIYLDFLNKIKSSITKISKLVPIKQLNASSIKLFRYLLKKTISFFFLKNFN